MTVVTGVGPLEPTAHPEPDAEVARPRTTSGIIVEFLSMAWLMVVGVWTFYFLYNLIDSRSVIVALEQELGATLPEPDLMPAGIADELFAAFCGHGFRGESVNSTFANAIVLVMGGLATYAVGLPLLLANMTRWAKSRTARRISATMFAIIAIQWALAIGFMDTINLVTYFGD